MPDLTSPHDVPLIIKTLEKPFLPGRQVFALYGDHVVIATVRGPLEFPDEIHEPDGHDSWRTLARTRKVSVLPFTDIEWIKSYESGISPDSTVRLTFLYKNARLSVLLPEEEGMPALWYLAEKFPDKLNPRVESAVDIRRKVRRCLIALCVLLDGWLVWALWDLWSAQSITGPEFLVDIIWRIYETRGFQTTAALSILCAAFFNLMMFAFSFFTPPAKIRTLNCSNCGNPLRGKRGDDCPECGTKIETSVSTRR